MVLMKKGSGGGLLRWWTDVICEDDGEDSDDGGVADEEMNSARFRILRDFRRDFFFTVFSFFETVYFFLTGSGI